MKNTLPFIYSTNILVYLLLTLNMKNFLTSKIQKCMCYPILVTLLKMRLHYGQSSHENATVASYNKVPPVKNCNHPVLHAIPLIMSRPEKYHLFEHNCNTFSAEVAIFLTGNKIPQHIQDLPSEVLNT